MHCFCRLLIASTVVVTALPASAAAQIVTPPPRQPQGIFGGTPRPEQDRLRQEVDLTLNLLGGYDDTVRPEGISGPPLDVRLRQSGYTGSADAALRYWRGRSDNWFSLQGRGYANGYSNLDVGTSSGGAVNADAQAAIGRRASLNVGQRVSSDPYFTFDSFSPLEPIVGVVGTPGADLSGSGLFERRSWTTNSAARLSYDLGRRDSADFSYSFSQRRFVDDERGNFHGHAASASYRRALGRAHGLRASYRFSDRELVDFPHTELVEPEALSRPVTTHTIDGGPEFRKRLSPTRTLFFSVGAGAMHVRTLSRDDRALLEYWAPFGQGAFTIDLARSWALGANYRRGVTVLEGLTHEAFVTDTGSVTLSGYLSPRVDVGLAGSYSLGQPRVTLEGPGELKTYTASAQLRVALTRQVAIFSEYSFYRYQFADPVAPAAGFPPRFNRNAVRVGLSLWVPLSGRYRTPRQ